MYYVSEHVDGPLQWLETLWTTEQETWKSKSCCMQHIWPAPLFVDLAYQRSTCAASQLASKRWHIRVCGLYEHAWHTIGQGGCAGEVIPINSAAQPLLGAMHCCGSAVASTYEHGRIHNLVWGLGGGGSNRGRATRPGMMLAACLAALPDRSLLQPKQAAGHVIIAVSHVRPIARRGRYLYISGSSATLQSLAFSCLHHLRWSNRQQRP